MCGRDGRTTKKRAIKNPSAREGFLFACVANLPAAAVTAAATAAATVALLGLGHVNANGAMSRSLITTASLTSPWVENALRRPSSFVSQLKLPTNNFFAITLSHLPERCLVGRARLANRGGPCVHPKQKPAPLAGNRCHNITNILFYFKYFSGPTAELPII
jgi:hypothetical protein